jgi:large subunit ribosomal protein L18
MNKKEHKSKNRRVQRVRKNILGTAEKPRLSIHRSLNHIYAQIIDDTSGNTLAAASSKSGDIAEEIKNAKSKVEKSKVVGGLIAKKALDAKIETVVFDRGSFKYHGRVKAVADGAREGGLKF